ncbi:MAG: hypothetical protein ACYC5M_14515 [Anaerolineae bacterium]
MDKMDKHEFRCPMCGNRVSAESVEHLASQVQQHLHDIHDQDASKEEALQMVRAKVAERQKDR